MPFWNKKNDKKEKSNEEPSYPKQQMPPPPQVAHHPMPTYPQGAFVQNTDQFYYTPTAPLQSVPNTGGVPFTVAVQRNDLPGQSENFCEGFLDGPDFSNRVPDRSIPPAPGSYYFYSHGNVAPAPSTCMMPSSSVAPPPGNVPKNSCPPPPSYDDVLSQEMKNKL